MVVMDDDKVVIAVMDDMVVMDGMVVMDDMVVMTTWW